MGTTNSDIFVRPRIESNDGDGERQRLEQREGARNQKTQEMVTQGWKIRDFRKLLRS